jgi:hypothetical protein
MLIKQTDGVVHAMLVYPSSSHHRHALRKTKKQRVGEATMAHILSNDGVSQLAYIAQIPGLHGTGRQPTLVNDSQRTLVHDTPTVAGTPRTQEGSIRHGHY